MFQKGVLEIFCLSLLWGPSFLFIKIALRDITPLTLVILRVGLGALLLYSVLKLKRLSLPKNLTVWKHCFILGVFVNGLPFVCFNYSLTRIPSSLSALINGTTPILTVLLANAFLKDERLTKHRALGIMIGLSGFIVLFLPKILGTNMSLDLLGMLLSFVASCSYAVGMVYARKYVQNSPPLVIPILQLFTSLTYLIPLAFMLENPVNLVEASLSAWSAVLGLAVLGTMLAYIMFYRIIDKHGATAVSMVTYLLPIFGTVLGVIFLDEIISLEFYIASFLILLGLMIMNRVIRIPSFNFLLEG